jgi:hypothetical protein
LLTLRQEYFNTVYDLMISKAIVFNGITAALIQDLGHPSTLDIEDFIDLSTRSGVGTNTVVFARRVLR